MTILLLVSCASDDPSIIPEKAFNNNIEAIVKNPYKDVPGKDFRTIPRFPKSMRIAYQDSRDQAQNSIICAYKTESEVEEVSVFYEKEMRLRGWVLKLKDDDLMMMIFVRQETGGLPMAQLMFRPGVEGGTIIDIIVQIEKKSN